MTCTFNNQADAFIIVDKVTDPAGATTTFDFTSSYGSPFTLTDTDAPNSSADLVPGTYSVAEAAEDGWDLTSATCSDGSPVGAIALAAGETVTCTFNNQELAAITIIKDADPNDLQDFTFQRSFGANFQLDDDTAVFLGDNTLSSSTQFVNLAPNLGYTVTETLPNSFWTFVGVSCVYTGTATPYPNVVNVVNGVTITPNPGDEVTCTFTNEKESPTRTQGFWKTHTSFTSSVLASMGSMQIGTSPNKLITTDAQLFGGYYASIPKKSIGGKRLPIDQARIQLLHQLITAKLNCAAFGCASSVNSMIAAADAAYSTGTISSILASASALDGYNNSGDTIIFSPPLPAPGSATPKLSQSTATPSYWDILP